ncbi:MAG TPA: LamG domain-containing protein [Gammaproteobacteria bacterium]|nr:LamG domain-containing protein [Gammaproteobacteria bacterium]
MGVNRKINHVLLAMTVISLFFFGATLLLTLNVYKKYKADNPVTTLPSSGDCLAEGLVAHWKFDDVIGKNTPDNTGLNNNGEFRFWFHELTRFVFGAPGVVEGVDRKGLEFRGRQWVSGGNNRCFNVEKFTIAVWVWQQDDNVKNRVIVPTIMAKSSWPYDGWWLCSTTEGIGGETKSREIDLGIAWGSGFTHVKSGYQLPLREWHHVAVSMDNTRNEVQFYIDGKPYGDMQSGVQSWLVNWNHDLFIGEYDGSGRWPWHGKLDDVRFYNRILSREDVYAIYTKVHRRFLPPE